MANTQGQNMELYNIRTTLHDQIVVFWPYVIIHNFHLVKTLGHFDYCEQQMLCTELVRTCHIIIIIIITTTTTTTTITYLLIYSTEQSPSWEAIWFCS